MDKHWCYAMQILAAGRENCKGLRYALSAEGYATGHNEEEMSAAQARNVMIHLLPFLYGLQKDTWRISSRDAEVKEAKHFEALTTHMATWQPSDLLRLISLAAWPSFT